MAGVTAIGAPVQIFIVPTAVLGAGVHGPFSSPQMGGSYSRYQIQITPGPSWPATGDVLTVFVEASTDGVTWKPDAQVTFGGGTWTDKSGATVTTAPWEVTIGTLNPGPNAIKLTTRPTDLYRVTLTALQTCAPVLKMFGVP